MYRLRLFIFYLLGFTLPLEGVILFGWSFAKLIGMLFLFVSFIAFTSFKPIKSPLFYLIAIYFFYSFVSLLWSYDIAVGIVKVFTYAQIFILGFIIIQTVKSISDINLFFLSYSFGCVFASINVIYNYLNNISYKGLDYYEGLEAVRYSAFDVDPNETSILLLLGIIYLLYKFSQQRSIYIKLVILIAVYLCLLSIILTASRTGILLFIITVSLLFINSKLNIKTAVKYLFILATSLFLTLYVQLIPMMTLDRLSSAIFSVSSGDFNDRENAWKSTIQIFSNNCFIGVGLGGLDESMRTYGLPVMASHNTYLGISAQLGAFGSLLFIGIVLYSFISLRDINPEYKWLFIQFIILSIGIFTLTYDQRKLIWIYFIFALVINQFNSRGKFQLSSY